MKAEFNHVANTKLIQPELNQFITLFLVFSLYYKLVKQLNLFHDAYPFHVSFKACLVSQYINLMMNLKFLAVLPVANKFVNFSILC